MASSPVPDGDERVVRITFNSDNQARGLLTHFAPPSYELICLGGGVYSGKTFLFGVQLDWRARPREDGYGCAETDQVGALLVNSLTTFRGGIYNEVCRLFRRLGRDIPIYGHQPPRSWQVTWAQQGIEIPALPSYNGILCTPDGVHVVVGSLHTKRSQHQLETVQFGWAWLEEAINNDLESNETVKERVRCSAGGVNNPDCAKYHHHTTTWTFNPPRGPHKYLYRKLDDLEEAAKNHYHAIREGETCDGCSFVDAEGEAYPRHHGPHLQHEGWPLLQQGVGKAIWIRSRTSDNKAHQNRGYLSGLAANMTKKTARRRLDGEILRETDGGAYEEFKRDNVRSVGYDADRVLYVCLDFNLRPRAAVFAQPMIPDAGEYPTEHHRSDDIKHIGVFGEYFYAGEMSDRNFAQALVRGDRGDGCDLQQRYTNEELRGLPPPCDSQCVQPCRLGHWNGLRAHRGAIRGFGDQRATHRSSHSDDLGSSWAIVETVFRQLRDYQRDVPSAQPSPRSRVDSVNAKFCNAFDIRSLWIDPRCEELIRDFEQVVWDESGSALREWREGVELLRTHLGDGLGYMIARLFPGGDEAIPASNVATTPFGQSFREPSMY